MELEIFYHNFANVLKYVMTVTKKVQVVQTLLKDTCQGYNLSYPIKRKLSKYSSWKSELQVEYFVMVCGSQL